MQLRGPRLPQLQTSTMWKQVETPDVLHNEPFETAPEVYAYLSLLTDVITGESAVLLTEGANLGGGWMRTGWLGIYYANSYPWVFHPNLGWVYVTEDRETGAWFHRNNMEWLWTKLNSTHRYM